MDERGDEYNCSYSQYVTGKPSSLKSLLFQREKPNRIRFEKLIFGVKLEWISGPSLSIIYSH